MAEFLLTSEEARIETQPLQKHSQVCLGFMFGFVLFVLFSFKQTYIGNGPPAWRSLSNWNRFMGIYFYKLLSTQGQNSFHKCLFPAACTHAYIADAPKGPRFVYRFRKLRALCIWDSSTVSFQRIHCYILTIKTTRYSTSIRSLTEFWCVKHTKAQGDKTCPSITATFAEALHTNTDLFISFLMILLYFSNLQTQFY